MQVARARTECAGSHLPARPRGASTPSPKLVRDGFHPVIIGKRDHVEVRGLTGDLAEFDVVLDRGGRAGAERTRRASASPRRRRSRLTKCERWWNCIRQRFPASEVRFVDTVCRPTKQRQARRRGTGAAMRRGHRHRRRAQQQHARTRRDLRAAIARASITCKARTICARNGLPARRPSASPPALRRRTR